MDLFDEIIEELKKPLFEFHSNENKFKLTELILNIQNNESYREYFISDIRSSSDKIIHLTLRNKKGLMIHIKFETPFNSYLTRKAYKLRARGILYNKDVIIHKSEEFTVDFEYDDNIDYNVLVFIIDVISMIIDDYNDIKVKEINNDKIEDDRFKLIELINHIATMIYFKKDSKLGIDPFEFLKGLKKLNKFSNNIKIIEEDPRRYISEFSIVNIGDLFINVKVISYLKYARDLGTFEMVVDAHSRNENKGKQIYHFVINQKPTDNLGIIFIESLNKEFLKVLNKHASLINSNSEPKEKEMIDQTESDVENTKDNLEYIKDTGFKNGNSYLPKEEIVIDTVENFNLISNSLEIFLKTLFGQDIFYENIYIGGSLSLLLHGFDVSANDIDIVIKSSSRHIESLQDSLDSFPRLASSVLSKDKRRSFKIPVYFHELDATFIIDILLIVESENDKKYNYLKHKSFRITSIKEIMDSRKGYKMSGMLREKDVHSSYKLMKQLEL